MAKKAITQPESEPLTAAKKPVKPKAPKATKSSPAKAKAAVAPKAATVSKAPKPTTGRAKTKITIAIEEIQLRAYFLAEDRQKQGLPSDPEADWVEAERQLKLEALAKPIL